MKPTASILPADAIRSPLTAAAPASAADKVPIVAGAKAAVTEGNPKASTAVVGADDDPGRQSNEIDGFIAAGARLIMVNALDGSVIAQVVRRAKDKGIVVGAFDVSPKGADITGMTNFPQTSRSYVSYVQHVVEAC